MSRLLLATRVVFATRKRRNPSFNKSAKLRFLFLSYFLLFFLASGSAELVRNFEKCSALVTWAFLGNKYTFSCEDHEQLAPWS